MTSPNATLGPVPEGFFHDLTAAEARVLMLDYDGTLAPFREKRDEAVPYPGVREALGEIVARAQTQLIIISGRAIGDLVPLLGLDPAPEMWGSHGWEHRTPEGRTERMPLPPEIESALSEARRIASHCGFDRHCEEKPVGLAIHWRGLPEAEREKLCASVKREWNPILGPNLFDLHEFDGGLELRAPGRDKGRVVKEILATLPQDAVCAYLGDDNTDEDGFIALRGRGLTALVRAELKQTNAEVWIKPPGDLLTFLQRWVNIDSERGIS